MKLKLLFISLTIIIMVTFAYMEDEWFFITTDTSKAFWTNSQQNQSAYLESGESYIAEWTVNASGFGKYELKVNVNGTGNISSIDVRFNATIFDKGNDTNLIPNYTCTGCSFKIVSGGTTTENPHVCDTNLTENESCVVEWNVSALGPYNSTWDLFSIINYTSTAQKQVTTETRKVRIVEYSWWNTSWNCRRMVNITQNTENTGNGIVEIRGFVPNDTRAVCDTINCSKEIRVLEINDSSQVYIPNLEITNITMVEVGANKYIYCSSANIRFNISLSSGQTKQIFVYYDNHIAEIDYDSLNQSLSDISTSDFTPQFKPELVWDLFYDSHLDVWWNQSSDLSSTNSRKQANLTKNIFQQLVYAPQVQANRQRQHFLDRIDDDIIYWIFVHGDIYQSTLPDYNQTRLIIRNSDPNEPLTADQIGDTQSDELKFAMIIASFSGDNDTTLTGCPLNNWLSKAFIDKGADCFLSFLGQDPVTTCSSGCSSCESDTYTPYVDEFNECFWGNISIGRTIRQASNNATSCSATDMNPIMVNSTVDGCDVALTN